MKCDWNQCSKFSTMNYLIYLVLSTYINYIFMNSPRMKDREPSDFGSFATNQRKTSTQSVFGRRIASEIVDERIKSYGQLESFYMPYLKKIFEDNKLNNPSLRSPEELLFSSRLLEMRESQTRKRIQFLQGENERKDKKIAQLNQKMIFLVEKVRMYEPNTPIDYDIPINSLEQSEKNIRKLQTLLNVRNQETVFRLKLKAMNLFQEFDMSKDDIAFINGLNSEATILQNVINKLKNKIRQTKAKSKILLEQSSKDKIEYEQLLEQTRRITQTNELLRINEKRIKQRLEDIKTQWTSSNEKLIERQKQIQVMDVQLFRLKRMLEEKQSLLMKSNSATFTKAVIVDDLRREYENQIKDQRTLITSSNIEVNELKHQLEFVNGELEQFKIKDKFKSEEQEKTSREYIRWKERCEWYEKQKEGKINFYEERNKVLQVEVQKLKNEISEVQSTEVLNSTKNIDLRNNCDSMSLELQFRYQEVQILEEKCRRLEDQLRKRQHQTNESSKQLLEDCMKRSCEDFQRKLREKDYEMRELMTGIKNDYEQRIEIKSHKYIVQIQNLQNQLKRYQQMPLIQKKSEFIYNKLQGMDSFKVLFDNT